MAHFPFRLFTILFMAILSVFNTKSHGFEIFCQNASIKPRTAIHRTIPINVMLGDSLNIYCTSSEKFYSCSLKRKTNKNIDSCKFRFNQPLLYPGEITPKQKTLERIVSKCDLDPKPFRIHVIEKNNERVCHLQINDLDYFGN